MWSVNQARAYSQLNTMMAVMVLDEVPASATSKGIKDVTNFIGAQASNTSLNTEKDPDKTWQIKKQDTGPGPGQYDTPTAI